MHKVCLLFQLAFKVWLNNGSEVDKGENLYKAEHGSDAILRILHHKIERQCVCAHEKFIRKGKERQREMLTFFPGGTRFWLVLRMCVRAFLMFFSFMLDSTAGGRKSEKPHSFLLRGD